MCLLISGAQGVDLLSESLTEVERLQHLKSVAVREERAYEVGRRTDIEREVGIVGRRGHLALREMKRQGAQIVGRAPIGPDDDMGQRCLVGEHAEVLGEIGLGREIIGHPEGLVGQTDSCHPVERVGGEVPACESQQIPALMEQLQGIGGDRLLRGLGPEAAIADRDQLVGLHGADDGLEELLAGGHVLEDDPLLDGKAVGEHAAHSERREHPPLHRVVVEHLGIIDIVAIAVLDVALDDDAEHVEDGVAMAVERRPRQGGTVGHLVVDPPLTELVERQPAVAPQRVDQPDILVKDQ